MRSLGLDVGERRIGIAISDPQGILARPLTIISTDEPEAYKAIRHIVQENKIGQIILGLPQNMDGSIGPQARQVQVFTAKLREVVNVPLIFEDERLSTVSAQQVMRENKKKSKVRGKVHDDAVAAAVILQSYLDSQRENQIQEADNS